MKNKLYKILRAKGYSKRECGYAFDRWKQRGIDLNKLKTKISEQKSCLNYYKQDAEWHIKWLRDQAYIGTLAYQGIAYFWNHEYRFSLRDCKDSERILVHDAFLREALDLSGKSPRHDEIVNSIIPNSI